MRSSSLFGFGLGKTFEGKTEKLTFVFRGLRSVNEKNTKMSLNFLNKFFVFKSLVSNTLKQFLLTKETPQPVRSENTKEFRGYD